MTLFERICEAVTMRKLWNGGATIAEIAKASGRRRRLVRARLLLTQLPKTCIDRRESRAQKPRSKYVTVIVGQGNYGEGWEDETQYPDTAEGRREARSDKKEYRENSQYPFRLIRRRVLRKEAE